MTVTYGFYNSVAGDRTYNAIQFSSLIDSLIIDGVFQNILDGLFVEDGTGLHVMVNGGRAWFDHTWTYNDAQLTLDITTPHAVLPRIDTVILETNSDSGTRANSIKMKDGTPSSSPVPPTLTHTSSINQYPLADVYVGPNVTEINQENITNRIGTSDCPWVVGILETINIDTLFAQWQDDFETWFTYLQDELDANQAANLLAQIMEHDHSNPLHTKVVSGGIADGAIGLLQMAATMRFQKLYEFVADGLSHPDFQSIPQTFTHLLLVFSGSVNHLDGGLVEADLYLRVNGDSGNNYYSLQWDRTLSVEFWQFGVTNPNTNGLHVGSFNAMPHGGDLNTSTALALIPFYKDTNKWKTIVNLSYAFGQSYGGIGLGGGTWKNTAAINRLTGNIAEQYNLYLSPGSVLSIYGLN